MYDYNFVEYFVVDCVVDCVVDAVNVDAVIVVVLLLFSSFSSLMFHARDPSIVKLTTMLLRPVARQLLTGSFRRRTSALGVWFAAGFSVGWLDQSGIVSWRISLLSDREGRLDWRGRSSRFDRTFSAFLARLEQT